MDPILPTTVPPPPSGPAAQPAPSDTTAKVVYILYLLSLVSGVTALVGVIMAYVYVGDAPEPLKSHYRFQIRTFWIGLLYGCVALLLTLVAIGVAVFVFLAVWLIVRCVKGLKAVDRHEQYPNVETWLW
ncbi:MAG TPA: hypothetical protein VIW03_01875 [Anaeromyxobacter sp.]